MKDHRYYRQAYDASRWTSFNPDRMAEQSLIWFEGVCEKFRAAGKDEAINKLSALYLKSLSAQARCASPMITGPARFPVERMKKYREWERNASEALSRFVDYTLNPPVKTARTELDYNLESKEYMIGDVKVLHNVEQNRLQLVYPGKPDTGTITTLKANGFKWSPRNAAWQRQLTPNALRSLPLVLPAQPV